MDKFTKEGCIWLADISDKKASDFCFLFELFENLNKYNGVQEERCQLLEKDFLFLQTSISRTAPKTLLTDLL